MKRILIIILFIIYNIVCFGENIIDESIYILQEDNRSFVNALSFSSDNKKILSGNGDGTLKVWDIKSGSLDLVMDNNFSSIYSAEFSKDSKIIASGGKDRLVKIWDAENGALLKSLYGHSEAIKFIKISEDSKRILSVSRDSNIRIWDVDKGSIFTSFNEEGGELVFIDFLLEENRIITVNDSSKIKIWDIKNRKVIRTIDGQSPSIKAAAISFDKKNIAIGGLDSKVKIIDLSSEKITKTFRGIMGTFNPEGTVIATMGMDGTIRTWRIESGEQLFTFEEKSNSVLNCMLFGKDGYFAVGGQKEEIFVWKDSSMKAKINDFFMARSMKNTTVTNKTGEMVAVVPENIICMIDSDGFIDKPFSGFVDLKDFESLYEIKSNIKLYAKNDLNVYPRPKKDIPLAFMSKGIIVHNLLYSKALNYYYYFSDTIKGWIKSEDIDTLKQCLSENRNFVIKNRDTFSYFSPAELKNKRYNPGEIMVMSFATDKGNFYYYKDNEWFNEKDLLVADYNNKGDRIFSAKEEALFQENLFDDNYKKVEFGKEFKVKLISKSHGMVTDPLTGESGYVKINDLTFKRPDLFDPVILVNEWSVSKDSILSIKGRIYDDNPIKALQINGVDMPLKQTNEMEKLNYNPEVAYNYEFKWMVIDGVQNSFDVKVIDLEGKKFSRSFEFSPDMKFSNINDFKLSNIVINEPQVIYTLKKIEGETETNIVKYHLRIENRGESYARRVEAKIKELTNLKLNYDDTIKIGDLAPGETKEYDILIKGKVESKSDIARFNISFEEARNLKPYSSVFSFNIGKAEPAKIELTSLDILDENRTGKIERGEKFVVSIGLGNTSKTIAKDVYFDVKPLDEGIVEIVGNSKKIGDIPVGEAKRLKLSFTANYMYKETDKIGFLISYKDAESKEKVTKKIEINLRK